MSAVAKRVRKKLGITQEVMAHYLGVFRTRLAQVETERKNLPDEAYFKVKDLVVLLEAAAKIPMPPVEPVHMEAFAGETIPRQERETTRIHEKIRAFIAKRDQLLTSQYQLNWALQQVEPESEMHKILSVGLVGLEERLRAYTDENYIKLERKRVEAEAWLSFLKGVNDTGS